ncbi:hypothetical protein Taro_028387 [Colocasia esculenta]|uniref:Uncharacterized protein n=1 Tax=Colocasia esculenta TaxID=4460 RepID=A0A843VKX7_COLES|nr:hypothetical protein [Colocasia esculenta]
MQEAEMEVYLEEKRASLKRPGSALQRQDKKKKTPMFLPTKVVPARVAAPTTSSGIVAEKPLCSQCGKHHGGEVCWVTSAAAAPAAAGPAPRAAGRPRAQAQVFALARDEAELAEHVIEGAMKDYDAILGLDWLEEHYALMDCRKKIIIFWIPSEDEFFHPLPKNKTGEKRGPKEELMCGVLSKSKQAGQRGDFKDRVQKVLQAWELFWRTDRAIEDSGRDCLVTKASFFNSFLVTPEGGLEANNMGEWFRIALLYLVLGYNVD